MTSEQRLHIKKIEKESSMKTIVVNTIPHERNYQNQVGDYSEHRETVIFNISKLGNEYYEAAVFLHEWVEFWLTKKRGITVEDIEAFDKSFEENRAEGDTSECGDSILAPYHKEHTFATEVEKMFCRELGIEWDDYSKVINEL